jgi:phosphatidylinositol alpha-1,6-mannosyltransferase
MILFVAQTFLPEAGVAPALMTGLVHALTLRGYPAEVYCRESHLAAVKAFDASRRYTVHRFGGPRFWRRLRMTGAIRRRIAQGGVTTLVTDSWKSLESLPPKALKNVRVVCLAHGNEYTGKAAHKGRVKSVLARANVVVANSNFTAGLVRPFAGQASVEVVLPGVTPPYGTLPGQTARAMEDRLLCIARLEPRKGIDQVIGALAVLKPQYPRLTLDIVGHGEDGPRLTELATALGVSGRVNFHSYVSDTARAELFQQARVFVLPNRADSSGVDGFTPAFLEAAAFGVPSVAGQAGGSPDAVLAGETGLIVNGDDIDSLTDALRRLLNDEALRRRLGEGAQKRFWAEFAWSEAVPRYEFILGLTGDKT